MIACGSTQVVMSLQMEFVIHLTWPTMPMDICLVLKIQEIGITMKK